MGLFNQTQRQQVIQLLLQLPGVQNNPQVRNMLSADLPASVRQILPQTGTAYHDIAALIDTVENESYWPPQGPPLPVSLLETAVSMAPEHTILRKQLDEIEMLAKELVLKIERLKDQSKEGASDQVHNTSLPTPLLRRVLTECFSNGELQNLCFDYYRSVFLGSQGQSHTERVQALIVYCEQEGQLDELIARLRQERGRCLERLRAEAKR